MVKRASAALLLLLLASPALAEDPLSDRIDAAAERIDAVLDRWRTALKAKEDLPVDDLLAAMQELAGIESAKAITAVAKHLAAKDLLVARCATHALRAAPDSLQLLAGKLAAERLDPRRYRPESRTLYTELIETIARSGYVGGFDAMRKTIALVKDGEVVLAVAEAVVALDDVRAAEPLFDWVNWNKGGKVEGAPMNERKRSDPQNPRSRGSQKMSGPGNDPNARQIGTGGVEAEPPSTQEILDRVWRLLFELLGRDFESWEDICRYFVEHRKDLKVKGAEFDRLAQAQEKAIRSLR